MTSHIALAYLPLTACISGLMKNRFLSLKARHRLVPFPHTGTFPTLWDKSKVMSLNPLASAAEPAGISAGHVKDPYLEVQCVDILCRSQ